MRSPAPTAHPEASWGWVKSWPYWPGASDPFTLASHPHQGTILTHHAILGRCVIPDHQHDGAAAGTEEEGRLAWAPEQGGGQCVRGPGRLEGEGHSPECLGVGHCPRPVNVQVSAAAEGGRGRHPRTGSQGGVLERVPKPGLLYFSHTQSLHMAITAQHPSRCRAGPRLGAHALVSQL